MPSFMQVWKGQGIRKWRHGQNDGFFVQLESPVLRILWFIPTSNEKGQALCRSLFLSLMFRVESWAMFHAFPVLGDCSFLAYFYVQLAKLQEIFIVHPLSSYMGWHYNRSCRVGLGQVFWSFLRL